VGCSLFVSRALGVWFSYQESRQALILLQQEKARSAAERIGQILFDLEQKIGTAAAPQHGVSHLEQRMVDSNGHLIAHPDIGLVLKHSNMTGLPQVRAAIAEPGRDSGELGNATNLVGQSVLTAFGVIPYLGWIVFVEEPMAHGLPAPVRTGDELEELADEFNRMSAQLHDSYTSLERKVALRTRELTRSAQMLHEAQRIAGLGSFSYDLASGSWTSSEVLDTLLGINESYARTARGWATLIHPDDLITLKNAFQSEVINKKTAMDNVLRIIRHSDRAERWVHGLAKVEVGDKGVAPPLPS
jgi:hypothetical protein